MEQSILAKVVKILKRFLGYLPTVSQLPNNFMNFLRFFFN